MTDCGEHWAEGKTPPHGKASVIPKMAVSAYEDRRACHRVHT